MFELSDCAALEMRMAVLMSQQEQSGFRFDLDAADRVRQELTKESEDIKATIRTRYLCC